MTVGQRTEVVTVNAETPTVDVLNARQAVVFQGSDIQELPTSRNVTSLLALTPGITSDYSPGSFSGICSGGVGVFCNPGVPGFNVGNNDAGRANSFFNLSCVTPGGSSSGCDNSATNMNQGRVMVDGAVINSGSSVVIGGLTQGYIADIANAQEITIQLSGALGESETGGASINIVPRTGGNRFAGNFNTTYTRQQWFDRNDKDYVGLNGLGVGRLPAMIAAFLMTFIVRSLAITFGWSLPVFRQTAKRERWKSDHKDAPTDERR